MELWIRSQNKADLIKAEMLGQTDGVITAYYTNGRCELGTYKTKERALEVLNEIQERVDFNIKLKLETCVYEMPED